MKNLLPHKRLGVRGPWLVLLHGYTVDGGMFAPVEGVLAQHYRLIIPDLRGYGAAWNWPGPYTFRQRIEDIVELIHYYTPSEPAWVLGYSMGGVLAQLVERHYSEKVAGLILAATFAYKPLTALERWQGRALPYALRMFPPATVANLIYPQAFGTESFPPELLEWYKKSLQRVRLEVLLADAEEIFRFDGRPFLSRIKKPVLVLAGSSDLIVPVHHAQLLAERIPGAHSVIYPNATHVLIFTHRRPFVRDVHRFILSALHTAGSPSLHFAPSQSLQ
ncbi:MAG: alpha/beta hydrolase [Bacteroidia bacterium]|nr:alpha/beta hydrolase [Bacteroidia bacterium]MDW8235062.1 alpha/beta hydrolase [Bacteroidia bacterium]